jgi:beta-xylosidase
MQTNRYSAARCSATTSLARHWISRLTLLLAVLPACTGGSDAKEDTTASGGVGGVGGGLGTGGVSTAGGVPGSGGATTGGASGGEIATGGTVIGTGGEVSTGGTGGTIVNPICPGDAAEAYLGSPRTVPGTIEAEDFDPGGYSDTTTGNEGGAYRTDVDVDIKALGTGYAIGWMTAGEWLEYTVDVLVEGDYGIVVRAGAVDAGRTLDIFQCGTSLTGPVAVPQIAAWGEMASTTTAPVHLAAGLQVIRVTVGGSDYLDFDSLTLQTDSVGTGGTGGTGGVSTGGVGTGGVPPTGGTGGISPWPPASTFSNPVLWEDLADDEVIRVGDVYYYTASNMHYSPGAPILRSYDLVNWEYAGHAIPVLDFASKYDLAGGRAYVKGTWASTLNYRESNSTFYWLGCIEFGQTYVYTASSVEGPWQKHPAINNCYYDAGLLIDDDDTMYVAYGSTTINVAQLGADGLSEVTHQEVYTSGVYLEGSRFFKRGNYYYIFVTRPASGQFILRSSDPFGPYEIRTVLDGLGAPTSIPGGGVPHQGGLVETQNGDWYYMAFVDAYPGGRIPVLAPVTWSADGWPSLELVNGRWGASYPYPDVPAPPREMKPHTGRDNFTGTALAPEWEWNHNPDNSRWSLSGGLRLQTATVTQDLYSARNTLTHRILGPSSTATIELDYSAMGNGDVAGLAMLRNSSAWIGIKKAGGATRVVMASGLTMDSDWNTTSNGAEVASASATGGTIWLRVSADIRPGANRQAAFSYSTDGTNFTALGSPFVLESAWQFFMGYRYAIFNYATEGLGGVVTVPWFEVTAP